jgi:hypothetical protein
VALTGEQMKIAEAIAARVDRLIKDGKSHATILGEMQGHLAGFKQLLDADVVQQAADRYPGFRQFAKILERLARGIHSGAIPVPGRQPARRETEPAGDLDRLAAAIDLRMRQLGEQAVPLSGVIQLMTPYILHLQRIWSSTSDEELAALCREYPDFHRYAALMEEAAEAERLKPTRAYDRLPELPDAVKELLSSLLGTAATLERDYQSVLDAAGGPAPADWLLPLKRRHAQWKADLIRFRVMIQAASIPQKSREILLPMLHGIAQRIETIKARAEGS